MQKNRSINTVQKTSSLAAALCDMRLLFILAALSLMSLKASSQSTVTQKPLRYVDAHALLITGRSAKLPAAGYNRIDSNLRSEIPARVAELSKNTAGVQVDFITNSKTIGFKWTIDNYSILPNMTPIAKNGLDLYGLNHGRFQFVATAAPSGEHSTKVAIHHLDGQMRHYRVYLPLYGSLTELYVGVDSGALIKAAGPTHQPKIVIYGTSITQGASASRPGLAYPAILSRHLAATVYNMGFSGSGKMELKMADIIGQMPADLYILDCVPNMTAELIDQRVIPFVQRLRKIRPSTPILFMESPVRETSYWDQEVQRRVATQNKAIMQAFRSLQASGMQNIYYQDAAGFTGQDHEATIDGTHLTDVGFSRLTTILEKKIKSILPPGCFR